MLYLKKEEGVVLMEEGIVLDMEEEVAEHLPVDSLEVDALVADPFEYVPPKFDYDTPKHQPVPSTLDPLPSKKHPSTTQQNMIDSILTKEPTLLEECLAMWWQQADRQESPALRSLSMVSFMWAYSIDARKARSCEPVLFWTKVWDTQVLGLTSREVKALKLFTRKSVLNLSVLQAKQYKCVHIEDKGKWRKGDVLYPRRQSVWWKYSKDVYHVLNDLSKKPTKGRVTKATYMAKSEYWQKVLKRGFFVEGVFVPRVQFRADRKNRLKAERKAEKKAARRAMMKEATREEAKSSSTHIRESREEEETSPRKLKLTWEECLYLWWQLADLQECSSLRCISLVTFVSALFPRTPDQECFFTFQFWSRVWRENALKLSPSQTLVMNPVWNSGEEDRLAVPIF